jgi:hypothetical protein
MAGRCSAFVVAAVVSVAGGVPAGCASGPPVSADAQTTPAISGVAAGAPRPDASSGEAPAAPAERRVDPRVELARASAGFRKTTRAGNEVYCRRDAPLGSRVAQEYCLTEEQLLRQYRRAQDVRDDMRKPQVCQGACTTGG